MKTSLMSCIAVGMLICGCAAKSQPQKPAAPAAARASAASLPRDPVIDAYVGAMRADLSEGKVQLINGVMKLSVDEGKIFWPIYEEYESELFELGDQRVELIRKFAAAQRLGKLSDQEASTLADGYFQFESQRLDMLKKYHGIISKELSPVRAAQFSQVEHRVGTVVDLMIASEVPLVQAGQGGQGAAVPARAN